MENTPVPMGDVVLPAGFTASAAAAQLAWLSTLGGEADVLGHELLRCQQQLRLVYEITAQLAQLDEPDAIQATLLRRYREMLGAGAIFVDRGGCCMKIDVGETDCAPVKVGPDAVRGVLSLHVEDVRAGRRALVPTLSARERATLGGAQALLGVLARPDTETGVVVALRPETEREFDTGDLLASEAVLTYGGQVLSNVLTVRHLQRTALETVCTLVNAIDAKDNYTSVHSERVGGFARLTGEAMGLPRTRLQTLEWAGMLHDVGKIGVPEHILNKPGVLTDAEFEQMKRHPTVGYEVLKPVAQLEPVLEAVLCHHENFDGSGYPKGLVGGHIPVDARIIHVVDIFDALTTNRPYRKSYDVNQAVALLEQGMGRATDPDVTRLFIETLRRHRVEDPSGFRVRFGHLTGSSTWVPTSC